MAIKKTITINPHSQPTYFNPLENVNDVDVQKQLDEVIIPMINSAAESCEGFSLSQNEKQKLKEIVAAGFKNKTNLNFAELKENLIEQNSSSPDLTRVIKLINMFL